MSDRPKRQKAQYRKYSEEEFIFDASEDSSDNLDADDDDFKAGGRRSNQGASLRSSGASGSSKVDSTAKQKSKKRKVEDSGAYTDAPESKRAHLEPQQSSDLGLQRDAILRAQFSMLGDMILKSVADQQSEAAVAAVIAEPVAAPPVVVAEAVAPAVNAPVKHVSLEKDAVRTPDWQPNKGTNQLFKNGSPLFELSSSWGFDSIMKDELHKIIVLLNQMERSVFFDWGEGFLKDGPPYYVYFLGDYEKAKKAFYKALPALNEIYQPAIQALYKRRNPSGDMCVRSDNIKIETSDLVGPGLATFGQSLYDLRKK